MGKAQKKLTHRKETKMKMYFFVMHGCEALEGRTMTGTIKADTPECATNKINMIWNGWPHTNPRVTELPENGLWWYVS